MTAARNWAEGLLCGLNAEAAVVQDDGGQLTAG